jgi:hypothetical protein
MKNEKADPRQLTAVAIRTTGSPRSSQPDGAATRAAFVSVPDTAAQTAADLGLSIDMLDVDRLRSWASLIDIHGADITHWGRVPFVVAKLCEIADGIERAVKEIGQLRALQTTLAGRVGVGQMPFFNYDGREPEYDQGHAVIVWYDDLYDLALARDSAEAALAKAEGR